MRRLQVLENFETHWREELKDPQPKGKSLIRAAFKGHDDTVLWSGLLFLVATCSQFAGPLLLFQIVKGLSCQSYYADPSSEDYFGCDPPTNARLYMCVIAVLNHRRRGDCLGAVYVYENLIFPGRPCVRPVPTVSLLVVCAACRLRNRIGSAEHGTCGTRCLKTCWRRGCMCMRVVMMMDMLRPAHSRVVLLRATESGFAWRMTFSQVLGHLASFRSDVHPVHDPRGE